MAKTNSVVTLEKPLPHISLIDWNARLHDHQNMAELRSTTAFDFRHSATQIRHETEAKTKWDTYHNDNRINVRVYELGEWVINLKNVLSRVDRESLALKDDKASTERELELVNVPLLITSEILSNRDARRSTELTYDTADIELKKELCIAETNKKLLVDHCQSIWEKLNRLEVVKYQLQHEHREKEEAKAIEDYNMTLESYCANITFKPDPTRIPPNSRTYTEWLHHSKNIIKTAEEELKDTLKFREALFVARERARNQLQSQTEFTDYIIRKRVFDTQRARNELKWLKLGMEENTKKIMVEISTLLAAIASKIGALKLAETRMENRTYRPGAELEVDELHHGLKDEVESIRITIKSLQEKLDCAKTIYNKLEKDAYRIQIDLDDKENTMEIDIRVLEMRKILNFKNTEKIDKLVLTNLFQEIPKDA